MKRAGRSSSAAGCAAAWSRNTTRICASSSRHRVSTSSDVRPRLNTRCRARPRAHCTATRRRRGNRTIQPAVRPAAGWLPSSPAWCQSRTDRISPGRSAFQRASVGAWGSSPRVDGSPSVRCRTRTATASARTSSRPRACATRRPCSIASRCRRSAIRS